jgi:signal transduction histidine kinase
VSPEPDAPPPETAWTVRPPGRIEQVAHTLPDWMGSIRFRLTALYSLFLFGLAAIVVAGIYIAVYMRLHEEPVSGRQKDVVIRLEPEPGEPQVSLQDFERRVNQRSLQLLRSYSFGALGLLFLGSLGVGWMVAGRVLAPIDRITGVAREIQATDLSRRISLQGPPDELKNLADTFDEMLGRIDEAFENQRRFIQEASHELRNPLAVIRTNLDVVLADESATNDDLRHTGEVVRRTAERMSQLVDDLLAYARQGSTVRELERIDAASVVADAAAEFEVPAEARGITLQAAPGEGLAVIGDRVALRQALANLLANAVRLAPEGSTIRLAAGRAGDEADPTDRWVWIAVEDQGPGIPEGQRELVFQRFWRGDGRRAREEGRSGLGLTIVRQIAESHRGSVRLAGNASGGSTFALWLPAAPSSPNGSV